MSSPRPRTLCFDLDGTLCTATARDYEGAEPFPWAIERVNQLARGGHEIIIMTARGAATGIDWEAVTRAQLERWGVVYHELRFGKPRADVFIDDRAVHTEAWRLDDAFGTPGSYRGAPAQRLPSASAGHVTSVVEVGRTFAGRPFRLSEHAERVHAAARGVGIRGVPSSREIRDAVERLLPDPGQTGGDDVAFAIRVSDVPGMGYLDAFESWAEERLDVSFRKLGQVASGLRRFLAPGEAGVSLAVGAAVDGAYPSSWPIRMARDGSLEDALGGDLGLVNDGQVILAPDRSLPTVAACWIEELAREVGLAVVPGSPTLQDIQRADECFVAGFPFCLIPVARADGKCFADAAPGPVTRRLLEVWSANAGVQIGAQTAALLERAGEPVAAP